MAGAALLWAAALWRQVSLHQFIISFPAPTLPILFVLIPIVGLADVGTVGVGIAVVGTVVCTL